MDIGQVLENAILNPDQQIRAESEAQLADAAQNHYVPYLGMLTQTLGSSEQKTEVRMLAGIALKNQISSKDNKVKLDQAQRWVMLESELKSQIKSTAVEALKSTDDRVASAAAQLVAAIADIELPINQWPELMNILVENTKNEQPDNVKRASLLTIGYICETADPSNSGVVSQANGILTAIVQGAQSSENNPTIRLTAINALVNSLEFIRENFEREGERNYIMQVVCEATQAPNTELQASAFGALARIMSLYYVHMKLYMEKALFGLTVAGMKSEDEKVACMAVEFWSTVCEEELGLTMYEDFDGPRENFHFADVAIHEILPTLLTLLTSQDEDADDDDWSVSMAAGACLQLFAQDTGNNVIRPTLQFVEANISHADWRFREAAVMAFGSILDGPDSEALAVLISQALMPILQLMNDESLHVKDTVAWCLGRIADLVIEGINVETDLPVIMQALLAGLGDHPKVSTNCCWTIMNLTEQLGHDGSHTDSTPISPYYQQLIPALLASASRNDNENSSRTSAYEALATLVIFSAKDSLNFVQELSAEVLQRLETTLNMQQQIIGMDDKANLEELQINLLGLLTNIIRRVGEDVSSASDRLMTLFLSLLQNKLPNSLIEEDIFIAIGSVAGAVGDKFTVYMDAFLPFLKAALEDPESQTCFTAIGLVADIANSLGGAILPYTEGIMTILMTNLQVESAPRDIKPFILSAFGDIASAIGASFGAFLPLVLEILQQASSLRAEIDASLDYIDYVFSIQEASLDAYVGIVAGLHDNPDILQSVVSPVFSFLEFVQNDYTFMKSESVLRSAVGLIGDIASIYPRGEFKDYYKLSWVAEVIKKARSDPDFSQQTKDVGRWAREQQKLQLAL
ncbi:ARM repeat-containing protein [Nadsonia fulvescens var. elongata DSM 6958]|uniref:Importin-95 n=1 Tax=Nadsonia fulvescens var. elongata DSM 6958 TaxID=857566 RepID=A0A1E3PLF1_9ASCO|nr:ARM repeat-containing protein [Nadsonia fulvescens var. elongata DSM 6958]